MFSQVKNTRDFGYTSSLAFQDNASINPDIASLEGERVSSSDSVNNKKLSLAEKCPLEIWLTVFDEGHLRNRDLLKLRLVCKILEKIANKGITNITLSNGECLEKALTLFNLKYILLKGRFELQAQDLVKIKPNTTVKYLTVSSCGGINDGNLPALLEKFPYLENLSLSSKPFVEFNSVNKWPTLNNVKVAYLSYNNNLVDKNLAVLLKKLPNLEHLDLRGCEELAFNSENEWPTLSDVKILKLSNHKYLTDENLSIFLSNFPKLEVLVIANCRKLKFNLVDNPQARIERISSDTATSIAQRDYTAIQDTVTSDLQLMWPFVNHIKKLNLAGYNQIDEEKILAFLGNFPKLEKLSLCNCIIGFNKSNIHQWPDLQNIKEIVFSEDDLLYSDWDTEVKYPNVEITECKFGHYSSDI